jgi:16S rRNA (guanine1207-N2)-methyltransferase
MLTSKTDRAGLERERVAASVMLPCFESAPGSRVLAVDDDHALLSAPLAERGFEVDSWWRCATANHSATPWPETGPFDSAIVRLSKDKFAFEMALHAAISVLTPGGTLWVYGANDEGIKSTPKRMRAVLDNVETVDIRKHCRVLRGIRTDAITELKQHLNDWAWTETLEYADGPHEHTVFPGVFAKGKLDPATRLLLSAMPAPEPNSTGLDFACGAGVIGGALLRREASVTLTQLDADAVAAHAAGINVPQARTVVGASLASLPSEDRYDWIASNPPIHEGKARDYGVLRELVRGSRAKLNPRGSMWLVVQRQADLRALLKANFRKATAVVEDARFRVWKAE